MVDPLGSGSPDLRVRLDRALRLLQTAPLRPVIVLVVGLAAGVAVGLAALAARPVAQPEVALTKAVRVTTTTAPPPPSLVHVTGAVLHPGVLRLPEGARVVDAIDAAGGARPDADLARVNLAEAVADGARVYIPAQGEALPPAPVTGGSAGGTGAGGGGSPSVVDLNRATAEELDRLPGVGPATAAAIVAHREQRGPFRSVDDLLQVRGIGTAKLEALRGQVRT